MLEFLSHKIHFAPPDPLGGGLAEEIAAEQAEPEAIILDDDYSEALADKWQRVLKEADSDSADNNLNRSIDE